MKNISYTFAELSDIEGVLALQERYLVTNLTEDEKKSGFVTTPFSVAQLNEIIGQQGLFLAKSNNIIIGYIFGGKWDYYKQWPIFKHMTTLFKDLKFKNFKISTSNSFQYGPICIEKEFRGTGLIKPLFEFMRVNMAKQYPLALTFINKINIPSTKAHTEKLKWTIIGDFHYNNSNYYILAYDMKNLVKN